MSFARSHRALDGVPRHPSPPINPGSKTDPERDLLAVMLRRIRSIKPPSGAEALRLLRDSFPDSPLTLRVAALERTTGRRRG